MIQTNLLQQEKGNLIFFRIWNILCAGSYVPSTNKGDVTVNESNEGFLISYNSDDLTIKVSPDSTTGEAHLVINNTVYNETDPFEI